MNICFLICGLPRSIDLVINNINEKFKDHKISLYFSISNLINENNYINNFNPADLLKYPNIKNILFNTDLYDLEYKNSLNYLNKLCKGINILDQDYDLYIIQRSDLIIENINFLSEIDIDNIYFSNGNNNKDLSNINKKINDQIIICKNLSQIIKLSNLFNYSKQNINYASICLYNYCTENNIQYRLIEINYKLVLSKCNIIAISGDSGSGKSTLMKKLGLIFLNKNVLEFETDRYHKWERGNTNYNNFTHLNPEANHLELMSNDIYNLKIGNEIYQVDYDHNTGKFTNKEKISSSDNIILCGLHTLLNNSTNNIIDIKIFMDTDRELIKKWKIQRDINQRNYNIEKILSTIEKREPDYIKYIEIQKLNADIIVNFYEINNCIKCKIHILNNMMFNKLLKYFTKYNYRISKNIIELNENIEQIYKNENISNYYICNNLNNYYEEILILLILYIY
jgi:uridine kinase